MRKSGISGLIDQYTSMYELIKTIYPEHKWDMYQFLKVPTGYIKDLLQNPILQKEFVNYLEKKFNIRQTNDWYSVTQKQLKQVLSIDIITAMKIIKNYYPEINVDKFNK